MERNIATRFSSISSFKKERKNKEIMKSKLTKIKKKKIFLPERKILATLGKLKQNKKHVWEKKKKCFFPEKSVSALNFEIESREFSRNELSCKIFNYANSNWSNFEIGNIIFSPGAL